jgi:hypothetical protein
VLSSVVLACASSALAQDTVTIPKSRLEELERKEAELQRLKQSATNAPAGAVPTPYNPATTATTMPGGRLPTPVPTHVSPPAASLPPLTEGEIVDALDIANQYFADAPSSDKRYRGQKIVVRGEIIGFEKPMFVRNYKVVLSGPDRSTKVVCDLITPRKYSAAYTIDHGNQIVGQFGENRETFGRVGQVVLVHGRCKGWKDSSVLITADWFELAH